MHYRVAAVRGKASDQTCGCGRPATEWAYDHADPEERWAVTPGRREHGARYSLTPDHYLPMCKPCHQRLDVQSAAELKGR